MRLTKLLLNLVKEMPAGICGSCGEFKWHTHKFVDLLLYSEDQWRYTDVSKEFSASFVKVFDHSYGEKPNRKLPQNADKSLLLCKHYNIPE